MVLLGRYLLPEGPSTSLMRTLSSCIGNYEDGLGQVLRIQVLGPSGSHLALGPRGSTDPSKGLLVWSHSGILTGYGI